MDSIIPFSIGSAASKNERIVDAGSFKTTGSAQTISITVSWTYGIGVSANHESDGLLFPIYFTPGMDNVYGTIYKEPNQSTAELILAHITKSSMQISNNLLVSYILISQE